MITKAVLNVSKEMFEASASLVQFTHACKCF